MTRQHPFKLARNQRGAVIIELAIVAPVFALMAIGVVDMSNAYSRKLALEQGGQRAIERIMQTTATTTVAGTLTSEALCQVNGTNTDGTCKTSPITASNVVVTYRLECTNSSGAMTVQTTTDVSTADDDCVAGTTKEARYIQIALTDNYAAMFPVHFSGYSSGGYPISATVGMRTK